MKLKPKELVYSTWFAFYLSWGLCDSCFCDFLIWSWSMQYATQLGKFVNYFWWFINSSFRFHPFLFSFMLLHIKRDFSKTEIFGNFESKLFFPPNFGLAKVIKSSFWIRLETFKHESLHFKFNLTKSIL